MRPVKSFVTSDVRFSSDCLSLPSPSPPEIIFLLLLHPPPRYHYDLNFMTIHGKSRFPGLYIWLRDGRKVRQLQS